MVAANMHGISHRCTTMLLSISAQKDTHDPSQSHKCNYWNREEKEKPTKSTLEREGDGERKELK